MIAANNISVLMGGIPLYTDVTFMINAKEKVGLAGKNGVGKSTMLKVLMGIQTIDDGTISKSKNINICYLPQELSHDSNKPIINEVQSANSKITEIGDRIEEINHALATRTDYESDSYMQLLDDLSDLNNEFNLLGGFEVAEQAETVLKGLGFDPNEFEMPYSSFSGGWKMRVELAKLLVQNPDVLLLDEPTNHLDIESIQWLEDYLKRFTGAVILISHDKQFLDNITNRTIEINNKKIYDYKCNYSNYLIKREEEMERQIAEYNNQQKEIADTEKLINKFRAKANKASFAQSLIKRLDKMDKIELDVSDNSAIRFEFPEPAHSGKIIAEIDIKNKHYGDKTIFSNTELTISKGEKIALIGKNGVGKSTFVKVLTKTTDFEGNIKFGHHVQTGYFAQDEAAKLDQNKTVFETIDDIAVGEVRKKIRAILGSFLFSEDDIDKQVKVLSGGEKTRLAICKLLLHPYNFIILDEPTNHLDIVSKEVLKNALVNYSGTVLLISHDRDFLNGLSNRIYYIRNKQISIYFDEVNDFLKKMNSNNDQNKAKQKEIVQKKEKDTKSKEERQFERELKKSAEKIERQIEKLEAELEETENKVTSIPTENFDDLENIYSEINKLKKSIEKKMEEWETITMELEELE